MPRDEVLDTLECGIVLVGSEVEGDFGQIDGVVRVRGQRRSAVHRSPAKRGAKQRERHDNYSNKCVAKRLRRFSGVRWPPAILIL